jgi:hypothetical protein
MVCSPAIAKTFVGVMVCSMSRKDTRKIMRQATKRGWRDVSEEYRSSGHYHLEWLDGSRITASYSPSCHRASKNLAADLRRVENAVDNDKSKPYITDKLGS